MLSYFFDDAEMKLLRRDGTTVPVADALRDVEYVLVYFSAQWCPPCHGFTPLLREFYDAHHSAKKFTVVFVSLDNAEEDMREYFVTRHGDYYAVPFAKAKPLATRWSKLYGFANLPTLLVFANREPRRIVAKRGHMMLRKDPCGVHFPWRNSDAVRATSHL
jgi:nucleoredoxin